MTKYKAISMATKALHCVVMEWLPEDYMTWECARFAARAVDSGTFLPGFTASRRLLACLCAFLASASQTWHLMYLMSLFTGKAGGALGLKAATSLLSANTVHRAAASCHLPWPISDLHCSSFD